MRKLVIAALSSALAAAAANADSPSLAAPGDCAQPIPQLEIGPIHSQTTPSTNGGSGIAGVPVPVVDLFAPISVVNDVVSEPQNVVDALVSWITPSTEDSLLSDPIAAVPTLVPVEPIVDPIVKLVQPVAPVSPILKIEPTAVVPPPSEPVLNVAPKTLTTVTDPITNTVDSLLGGRSR